MQGDRDRSDSPRRARRSAAVSEAGRRRERSAAAGRTSTGRRSRLAERGQVSLTLIVPAQAREPLRAIARRLRAGEGLAEALSAARSAQPAGDAHGSGGAAEPGQAGEAPCVEAGDLAQDGAGAVAELAERVRRQAGDIARLQAEVEGFKGRLAQAQAQGRDADGRAQAHSRRADELVHKLDRTQAALMQARNTEREDRHYLVDVRRLPSWVRWWVERYHQDRSAARP